MKLFRIASMAYPVFDGTGASLYPGRWNRIGQKVIYCGLSPSLCALETLVHIGRSFPRPANHGLIEIEVQNNIAIESVPIEVLLEGWNDPFPTKQTRSIGAEWFSSSRTLILKAPSVASPGDHVFVINQRHREFASLVATPPIVYTFDERLFSA